MWVGMGMWKTQMQDTLKIWTVIGGGGSEP
jgi:hypothetical protein